MTKLRCCFCQQELNQDNPQIIECRNDDCKKSYFMYGSKELWQELIRTRKALEKAKLVLVDLRDHAELDGIQEWDVYETLSEITALEQKD